MLHYTLRVRSEVRRRVWNAQISGDEYSWVNTTEGK